MAGLRYGKIRTLRRRHDKSCCLRQYQAEDGTSVGFELYAAHASTVVSFVMLPASFAMTVVADKQRPISV